MQQARCNCIYRMQCELLPSYQTREKIMALCVCVACVCVCVLFVYDQRRINQDHV